MSFIDYLIIELNIAGNMPMSTDDLLKILQKIKKQMEADDIDELRGDFDPYWD